MPEDKELKKETAEAPKADKAAEPTKSEDKAKDAKVSDVEEKKVAAPKKGTKKKPRKRIVPEGRAYIQASFNNTLVTITDSEGNALAQSSAGANGFKGPKKATPYAAQIAAEKAVEKAKMYGVERVTVFIKGAGNGREQSIRGLHTGGLNIESITDVTALPHNGCRPKKTRRV